MSKGPPAVAKGGKPSPEKPEKRKEWRRPDTGGPEPGQKAVVVTDAPDEPRERMDYFTAMAMNRVAEGANDPHLAAIAGEFLKAYAQAYPDSGVAAKLKELGAG